MTRDTRQELRVNGPTWKWMAGILLAVVMGAASYVISNMFYSKTEAAKLEAEYQAHCREAEYRNILQKEQNQRVNDSIKDLNREQRRTSDNVIRIGEALRVRNLDTGDSE